MKARIRVDPTGILTHSRCRSVAFNSDLASDGDGKYDCRAVTGPVEPGFEAAAAVYTATAKAGIESTIRLNLFIFGFSSTHASLSGVLASQRYHFTLIPELIDGCAGSGDPVSASLFPDQTTGIPTISADDRRVTEALIDDRLADADFKTESAQIAAGHRAITRQRLKQFVIGSAEDLPGKNPACENLWLLSP